MYIYKKKLKFKNPLQFASLRGDRMLLQHADNRAWVPAVQWHHLSWVLTENVYGPGPSARARGEEESQPIYQSSVIALGRVQERWGQKMESQRKPSPSRVKEALSCHSKPRDLHQPGLGEALRSLQPSLGAWKTGPFLDSPERKVQWRGTEWEAMNGLNAGQTFLSLLVPIWHFNSPDFKTFLPLGNILSCRERKKTAAHS